MVAKVHFLLLCSFALAIVLGLFIGAQFVSQAVSIVEDSGSVENAGYFFLYVIFAPAVLLFFLRYYKGRKLFFYAELLLEFSALQILLSLFLNEFYSLVLALALVAVRAFFAQLKQPLLFLASVVVGALLGSSFDLIPALVLSFLLAAYDYFAVFKSKHMVTLAKELQKRQAAFAIQFTVPPQAADKRVSKGKAGEGKGGKTEPRLRTQGESILLGTGDFVIPVLLSVSVLKSSVLSAMAMGIGAFVGLSVLLFIMQKTKGYYPALPPIVLFGTLFYCLSLLFFF